MEKNVFVDLKKGHLKVIVVRLTEGTYLKKKQLFKIAFILFTLIFERSVFRDKIIITVGVRCIESHFFFFSLMNIPILKFLLHNQAGC